MATESAAAPLNLRHDVACGRGALDAGTYPSLAAPVPTLTSATVLAARAGMPQPEAAAVLGQLLPALPRFDLPLRLDSAELVRRQAELAHGLPWHPAALAFWRRAGAPIPWPLYLAHFPRRTAHGSDEDALERRTEASAP